MKRMKAGLFKANCAVGEFSHVTFRSLPRSEPPHPVIIDFMIRHGFITPDNEGDFLDIITRIHRRFDFESYIPH